MYAAAVLKSMLEDSHVPGAIEAELIPTDRILQRWAVSIGEGLPSESWDDRPMSRPPPLDDDTSIVVDQIVMKAPPRTKTLVSHWYKTPAPSQIIAKRLGMSRRALYVGHRLSLNFLKLKFEMANNMTLDRLLHSRVYISAIVDEIVSGLPSKAGRSRF